MIAGLSKVTVFTTRLGKQKVGTKPEESWFALLLAPDRHYGSTINSFASGL
jgi:hypothetical protein